jgi:hypothetical protein
VNQKENASLHLDERPERYTGRFDGNICRLPHLEVGCKVSSSFRKLALISNKTVGAGAR